MIEYCLSIYIYDKLYNRSNILFAENDNTVRLSHPLNGLLYTIKKPFILVKTLTGLNTISIRYDSIELNRKISDLFDITYSKPDVNETNIISDHHYVYSPTVSKIIHDILNGNIASHTYMSPYNDGTIISLLETEPDRTLLRLDIVKYSMPDNLVKIHPHISNTIINLNLFQYRFVDRVIKVITNNNPEKINISDYLAITT